MAAASQQLCDVFQAASADGAAFAVACEDGSIRMHKLRFDPVQSTYGHRFAYRWATVKAIYCASMASCSYCTSVPGLTMIMHVMQSLAYRHCGAALAHWGARQGLLPHASAAARTASSVRTDLGFL